MKSLGIETWQFGACERALGSFAKEPLAIENRKHQGRRVEGLSLGCTQVRGPMDNGARPTNEMGRKPGGHAVCLRTEMSYLESAHWRGAKIFADKLST